MNKALKENLIAKLGSSFHYLTKQIEDINKRLSAFKFVGQTYSFHKFINPKLQALHDLTEELVSKGELDETVPTVRRGIKELEELLLQDEDNIKLLEDYRNYFNFDIHIETKNAQGKLVSSPLSKVMGVLSGGQRQAPYYVAIAASMSSAYYPENYTDNTDGIGLVIFDEAFDKLDIPNTQRLIHLFEEMNLQVIVAAPEEKRSSLIECVSSIVSVQRIPSTPDLFMDTEIIGQKAKEMMRAENPVHKSLEDMTT